MATTQIHDPASLHPWHQTPGYESLTVEGSTDQEVRDAVQEATDQGWKPWIVGHTTLEDGTQQPGAYLYRPLPGTVEPDPPR